MVGESTPADGGHRHGVFFDRPPLALIEALDTLLGDPEKIDPKEGA
jgi:hypothetical protein